MRILGVDPGLQVTGYGILDVEVSAAEGMPGFRVVEAGVVKTRPSDGLAERLKKIYVALSDIAGEFKPDLVAIEKLYAKYAHPETAILMGHARGVVCLVSGMKGIPLLSLASTHVKKAVTGRGRAKKNQMQRMVQYTLGLDELPEPPDVADALGVAIACALQTRGSRT